MDDTTLQLLSEQFAADVTEATALKYDLRYAFRARVNGLLYWTCPRCSFPNSVDFRLSSYTVECCNRGCKRRYGFGHILHLLSATHHVLPPDMILPGTTAGRGERTGTTFLQPGTWGPSGSRGSSAVVLPAPGERYDPMPEGELGRWRNGQAIHRIRVA